MYGFPFEFCPTLFDSEFILTRFTKIFFLEKGMGNDEQSWCLVLNRLDHKSMEYRYCSNCGRSTGIGLFACPRCNGVFYDSKECQTTHWPVHKKQCREISRRKEHNEHLKKATLDQKSKRKANSKQEHAGTGHGRHAEGGGVAGSRHTPGGSPTPFGDRPDSRSAKGDRKGGVGDRNRRGGGKDGEDGQFGEGGGGGGGGGGGRGGRGETWSIILVSCFTNPNTDTKVNQT